jgi:hypothetical protein
MVFSVVGKRRTASERGIKHGSKHGLSNKHNIQDQISCLITAWMLSFSQIHSAAHIHQDTVNTIDMTAPESPVPRQEDEDPVGKECTVIPAGAE